jgi:hypothetical protein
VPQPATLPRAPVVVVVLVVVLVVVAAEIVVLIVTLAAVAVTELYQSIWLQPGFKGETE